MEFLWKPAQSGKTRTIQQMIQADDGVKNHLNIVICSNNRLLVSQTRSRMDRDVYSFETGSTSSGDSDSSDPADDAIVGGVYSWMSGTKKSNIPVDALAWRIFKGEVSMVVCCSHKARYRHMKKLMSELESVRFAKPINVWIDEADVSVKTWSNPEFDFSRMSCVRRMTLVSATFEEVFHYYPRIRVKAFPETHPECYRGLRDCNIVEEVGCGSAITYLESVLEKHRDELVRPGVRIFAPGDIKVDTHDLVADSLTSHGFAVMVLNGREKGFRMPDGRREPISLTMSEEDPDELSRMLAQKYVELGLSRFPFAVTGHLCLGRGITFQSREFLFDFGIIPDIAADAAAYQCVARVLGNIGSFSDKVPTIYMSENMTRATVRQEKIATNIARLVHENEWVDVGKDQVAEAAGDEPPVTQWGIPIRVSLPEAILQNPYIDAHLSAKSRTWLTDAILPLIPAAERAVLEGRTLKNKRVYEFVHAGGIQTVHRSFVAGREGRPGGGVLKDVALTRTEFFWMDIATADMPGIPKGTLYVTYGL